MQDIEQTATAGQEPQESEQSRSIRLYAEAVEKALDATVVEAGGDVLTMVAALNAVTAKFLSMLPDRRTRQRIMKAIDADIRTTTTRYIHMRNVANKA